MFNVGSIPPPARARAERRAALGLASCTHERTHDATGALMSTAHTAITCTVTGLRAPGERGGREAVRGLCRYSAVHRSPDASGVSTRVSSSGARAVRRRSRNAIVPAADPERPIAESETHRSLPDYSGPHTYLLHCWYVIGVYRKVTRTRGKSSLLLYSTCSCEQNHLFSWSATNCLLGLSSLSAHPSMTSDEAPSPRQGDS